MNQKQHRDTAAEQAARYRLMTESPVESLVCKLAGPTIVSMMVTTFYNLADTYFVSQISTSASAAVGIVFSLMAIIQAVGFFFGHGSGNYISRALGRRETQAAEEMASVGFFSAFAVGTFIMVLGLCFLTPLARLLGSTDTILPYAVDYLRLILVGAPYMTSQLVLNNQLRFQGNAFFAMVGITAGAVLNLILDPILIFACGMGISGAALATIFSQLVSFLLLFLGVRISSSVNIRLRCFKPRRELLIAIVNGGSPSLLRQGFNSISAVCLARAAGIYGDAAIAGMSIVTRVMMFANSCLIGFGQGFQPVCGFNYGAGRYDRVKKAFRFCVRLSFVALCAIAALCFTFAPQVIGLFRRDADVVSVGTAALRFQCMTFPLASWVVISNMMSQTMGKAFRASFLAVARQGLFFIPAVMILPVFLGLRGVELSQMVADVITFAVAIPIQLGLLREMDKEDSLRS